MKYDITAKTTRYNDRLFRSRLEARYAAFFDLLGINWEYEPFDLNGWSPDFIIRCKNFETLVEVKPKYLINVELYVKMYEGSINTEYKLLLLSDNCVDLDFGTFNGVMPLIESEGFTFFHNNKTYPEFSASFICRDKSKNVSIMEWDNFHINTATWSPIEGKELLKLWTEAANKVMFLKPY